MSGYLGLVARLAESGDLPASWRPAFEAVPRSLFVPDVIWRFEDGDWVSLDRTDDPDTWAERIVADEPVVTQVDDGATPPGQPGESATSSTSMPSIVAMMLDRLGVQDGDRVLEIGTGTGWNAGLLAARLGDDNVTSVEVDPELADNARSALKRAGRNPSVITGDGIAGYPPGAPFDRIICTASAYPIPYEWVGQTRPGGRIVTPWGSRLHNGALLALDVADDGTASGRFDGNVAFMRLRAQRDLPDAVDEIGDAAESTSGVDMIDVVGGFDGPFAIGVMVPDCYEYYDRDPDDGHYTVMHLDDPDSGSWASVVLDQVHPYPVRQHGPRKLWDEVETAYDWWVEHDRPEHTRFGMTVTPDRQWVWLDSPDQPVPGR